MVNKIINYIIILILLLSLSACSGSFNFEENQYEEELKEEPKEQAKEELKEQPKEYYFYNNSQYIINEEAFNDNFDGYNLTELGIFKDEKMNLLIDLSIKLEYSTNENDIELLLIKAKNEKLNMLNALIFKNYETIDTKYGTILFLENSFYAFYPMHTFDIVLFESEEFDIDKNNLVINNFLNEFGVNNQKVENLATFDFNKYLEEYLSIMQSKSLNIGRQSQEQVRTNIEVIQVFAEGTNDGKITTGVDNMKLIVRLGSGSVPIKLNDLLLRFDTMSGSQSVTYSGDNTFNELNYGVDYKIKGTNYYDNFLSVGDLIEITFTYNSINDIEESETATLRLLTKNGAVKPVQLTTPSAMTEKITYLYP